MKNTWKKTICLLLAVIMLLCCTACANANESTDAQTTQQNDTEQTLVTLKTSGQNVVQTALPLYEGEKMKIWENMGYDVTRTHYSSGSPQLEAQPAGDWDIGWIGATACITGLLSYDMVLIGMSGYDYTNMAFARADDSICQAGDRGVPGTLGTADDWRGKDIIVSMGTVSYCDFALTLNALGLTEEDVNIINMDGSTGLQAFLMGEGDIIFNSSSYAITLLSDEYKDQYPCVHTMSGMNAGMAGCIVAGRDFVEKNEDVVVDYLEGALEVLLWCEDESNRAEMSKDFQTLMQEEFGTESSDETTAMTVELTHFNDLAFYESLVEKDADGLSGLEREFDKFYGYHVMFGAREESDRDTVLKSVDTTYLEKAIEKYKQIHELNQ